MSYETEYDYDRVRSFIDYDPETGKFWWLISPAKNVRAGNEAGTTKTTRTKDDGQPAQYRYIKLGEADVPAARVAWLLGHGEWPQARIRFRDGDTMNLRLDNLEMQSAIGMKYDREDRDSRKAWMKSHREAYPLNWKESDLRRKFNIGMAEYGDMLVAQGGVCAICGEKETEHRNGERKMLAVDHDHDTGAIRGLLCTACNQGIGKLKDSPAILQKAIHYLAKHGKVVDNEAIPQGTPDTIADQTDRADAVQTDQLNLAQEGTQ